MWGKILQKNLPKFKELVAYPTHQVDLNTLEVLPQGIVNDDVDLNMTVEQSDEDDPLDNWCLILNIVILSQ